MFKVNYCVEVCLIFFDTSNYDCVIIAKEMFNFLPRINSLTISSSFLLLNISAMKYSNSICVFFP